MRPDEIFRRVSMDGEHRQIGLRAASLQCYEESEGRREKAVEETEQGCIVRWQENRC